MSSGLLPAIVVATEASRYSGSVVSCIVGRKYARLVVGLSRGDVDSYVGEEGHCDCPAGEIHLRVELVTGIATDTRNKGLESSVTLGSTVDPRDGGELTTRLVQADVIPCPADMHVCETSGLLTDGDEDLDWMDDDDDY